LAVSGTASAGGTTQVAVQKVSSWAEECEDDEEHKKIEFIQLPTAPRSARILEDDSISQNGPFYARVSNLPFDTNEDEVADFFMENNINIHEMKLARDDTNDRLRGFGLLEFETREDLIDALTLADLSVRGRRIRLEVTTDPDGISGRTVRKRYDNYTPRDSANESTNWRDRKESNFETIDNGRDRDRDRDGRDGGRRNYQSRSNFQNRHDNNNNNNNTGEDSNWRAREPQHQQDSPPPERKRFERGGGGGRDRDRRFGGRDSREPREMTQEERPKLNIAPRTLPLPELNFPKEEELERGTRKISLNGDHDDSGLPDEDEKESVPKVEAPKPKPVPKENIFGMAKPVDTAAREKIIEEKMEHERIERVRAEKERREKEREEEDSTQNVADKKEVIVIRTENSRRQDETNWRKRDDPPANHNGSSLDNKNIRGGPRQIGRGELKL
jgi:translation initiation factor 4B